MLHPPHEERRCRDLPPPGELGREQVGRVMPAPQLPHRVGGDRRDHIDRRPVDPLDYELGRERRDPAEAALLPGPDEGARRPGIGDCRARGGERKPASGALPATRDGPDGRCPAAAAAGTCKRPKLDSTRRTERVCRDATGDTALRQEKIDQPRR
jgi:hypothetical protein